MADSTEADSRLRKRPRTEDYRPNWVPHYQFRVRQQHVSRIPTTGNAKKDGKWRGEYHGKKSSDWVPLCKPLKAAIEAVTSRRDTARKRIYSDNFSRESLLSIDGLNRTAGMGWLESDVWWDKVVSVTKRDANDCEFVYDIDMDGTVFACNVGVFLHDTSQAVSPPVEKSRLKAC